MSVMLACCPSFRTWVSSLTFSFLSESARVSSLLSLSNFWTVPVSCWLVDEVSPIVDALDPEVEPAPIEPVLDDPVPIDSLEPVLDDPVPIDPAAPLELEPVVSELLPVPFESVLPAVSELSLPIELEPLFSEVESEVELEPPMRSLDSPDVEEPPVVPYCACAGGAAASSPARPRPATVPHPICFIRNPPAPCEFGARPVAEALWMLRIR
jgi:hypothetical protein